MRGQAAVEWIVVLSVAMLILGVMLSMNDDSYRFFSDNFRVGKAKAALNDLKSAADFVYSQGRDAKTTVFLTVPASCNISIDTLPGGKGRIAAAVYVKGEEEWFDVYTDANLTGEVPQAPGSYCMNVEYAGSEVNITRSAGSC